MRTREQINSVIIMPVWRQKRPHSSLKSLARSWYIEIMSLGYEIRWIRYGECRWFCGNMTNDDSERGRKTLQLVTEHVNHSFSGLCQGHLVCFGLKEHYESKLIDPQWLPERIRIKGAMQWVMSASSSPSRALKLFGEGSAFREMPAWVMRLESMKLSSVQN